MRRSRAAGLGALLLGLLAGGCGYTVGGNLPPHVKTVAVPIFKNLTEQPAIENRTDVRNRTTNRHGIAGYLDDQHLARLIHDALVA